MNEKHHFRRAFDALFEEIPDPPAFEQIEALILQPGRKLVVPTWVVAVAVATAGILLIGGLAISQSPDTGPVQLTVADLPESSATVEVTPPSSRPSVVTTAPEPGIELGQLFDRRLPWILVFDNGYDGISALDVNKGVLWESRVLGGRPGDQPYRLSEINGKLIVGWGEIFSHDVTTRESVQIGLATIYVPAVEKDSVWLVDYGGRIGANPPIVWRVGTDGSELTDRRVVEAAGYPAMGIPGGLALETDRGVVLWDHETGSASLTLGSQPGFVSDTTESGMIAWCQGVCDQLYVHHIEGDLRAYRHRDGVTSFRARQGRFSPNGQYFAIPAGPDVVLIDTAHSQLEVAMTFPDEPPDYLAWTPNSSGFFVASHSYSLSQLALGYHDVITGHSEVIEAPFGGKLSFVVMPTDDAENLLGSNCPVTVPPQPGYAAPEPYPLVHPSDHHIWYGDDRLWTLLEANGDHGRRKSVWWSTNFPGGGQEPQPPITVTWQRLDADEFAIIDNGGHGSSGDGGGDKWYMVGGEDPRQLGCWRVTATYKGATLSYVYEY